MKFGITVSQKMVDRSAAEPFGKLHDYVREMEDLGYDLAWLGHHRFSPHGGVRRKRGGRAVRAPTGVPDLERHKAELRLFAREVMPQFRG